MGIGNAKEKTKGEKMHQTNKFPLFMTLAMTCCVGIYNRMYQGKISIRNYILRSIRSFPVHQKPNNAAHSYYKRPNRRHNIPNINKKSDNIYLVTNKSKQLFLRENKIIPRQCLLTRYL